MTVYLMTGTPGSGKSLHMASQILWGLRWKRPIVANFDVAYESPYFKQCENDELTPKWLELYARSYFKARPFREGEISLYIDECQTKFDARRWNDKDRKDWNRFFQQHRKMGYNVYLVAQHDQMIDKQIRAVVEYEIKHRKVNNFGWVGKMAHIVALGHPVVCAITYWYGMRERLSSEFFVGTKRLYGMYDTTKIFDV